MKVLLWIVLLGGALFALHYFALWAERRGWIYYKYRKASPASVGSAFLQVQSLLEPGKKHIVESRLEHVAEEDESGDRPDQPENDKVG
jgi:hypothetical protein